MSPRLTVSAVLIAGISAGVAVSPVIFMTTTVVVALLIGGFRSQSNTPAPVDEWSVFSADVRSAVTDSLAALPAGDARSSLLDVAVCARSLLASRSNAFDPSHERTTREHVERLVEACCGTSLELSRLDDALNTDRAGGDPSTRDRLGPARSVLLSRLKDAAGALRDLYAAGLANDSAASARVAELTSELAGDAAARAAAVGELAKLLETVRADGRSRT